ncbi:MAG: DUF1566 domain-containing protein [Treponema sp.]|jgi:hypothetical protein|nr:DUF1566 domain-containing protein [Treponema sp.]
MGQSDGSKKDYKIGETGPAGGIVFYDHGFTVDGWRYLEAAPAVSEFTVQWGSELKVDGTETTVGSGWRNTQLIIGAALRESENAARLCAALKINGYKNWFLPSKNELDLMYENLKQKGHGGFENGRYWSSSQTGDDSDYVWGQEFSDGSRNEYSKGYTDFVRAVHAF